MFRGISQRFASALFDISQSRISKIFHEIIKKMSEVFVPIYIGSQCFQRHNIIHNHSPGWVKLLLPNAAAMIDSTYIYIQKSWNFNNQRKSYCQHKADNLVKMMAVMLLDGKWFDVYGPYYSDGHNNDELIWNTLSDDNVEIYDNKDLFAQRQQLHTTFTKNDMFIGDRGFSRCKGKWNLYTPDSICKGEAQLTTTKANQTRCITRVRNAIERGFGRLKQWKFVDCVVNTEYVPIIGTVMRILCAVDNAYFSELVEDSDDALTNAKATISNLQLENEVISLEANTSGWKKANTSDISSIIPSYNDEDIKKVCGEYSLRIAHAYLGHIQQQWKTYIHRDFASTIKVTNIISRYKTTDNPKKHTVWIRFGQNKLDGIASYCTCKSGLRTAGGTCSHVTAALIASKYWKNNQKIPSFYTTATALFINVLDCTAYKERNKNRKMPTDDDETISNTVSQTSLSEESVNEESTDEESIDEKSANEGSMNDELTNEVASGNNTNDENANKNQYNLRKRPRIVYY
ncbi:unnamed protein product [Rotaria sp. Silwood1]|nr:unnamed protein product [Rotaria sp. Silwood1]CAF5026974.1 unnamed protein product [Rotaria sp. Silwood1]CAF5119618.1 unnamed protein product [Rotaria sp. Silwood1]